MRRIFSAALGAVLAVAASQAALAQSKPPLKLGGILDMSGLYADITGAGSETAAKMAAGASQSPMRATSIFAPAACRWSRSS